MIRIIENGPLQTYTPQLAPLVETGRGAMTLTECLIASFDGVVPNTPRIPGHDSRHMLWSVRDASSPRLVEVRQLGYKPGDYRFALSLLQVHKTYDSKEELWHLISRYADYSQLRPLAYSELTALSEGNGKGPYSRLHMRSFRTCDFVGIVGYVNHETVIKTNVELHYLSPQDWASEWEMMGARQFFYLPPPQPERD